MRQRLDADPAVAQSLKKRPGGFLDAEFLSVLLTVQGGYQTLLTNPANSPEKLLIKLLEKSVDEDDVRTVCAGLKDLELITQFTGLCLGKSFGVLFSSEHPQTWLALADRLNMTTVAELQLHIEKICARTAALLAHFLQRVVT